MKKILFALLILALALFCSCQSKSISFVNGDEIKVHPGDDFTLELEENPTTGYSWSYEIEGDCILLASENYKQNKAKDGFVGVGGVHSFNFTALKEGYAKIKFCYMRPWENEAIETKEVNVRVKKKKVNVSVGLQLSHTQTL
ncbi:MAG: protease inhibitor I42 family protein [Sphaerochaetaceae bacterium]|nr:protease inhibitor I42 family protein [Sphaerochaetaceae bacterium]